MIFIGGGVPVSSRTCPFIGGRIWKWPWAIEEQEHDEAGSHVGVDGLYILDNWNGPHFQEDKLAYSTQKCSQSRWLLGSKISW